MPDQFVLPDHVDESDELAVRSAMVEWAREQTEARGYRLGRRLLTLCDRYVLGDFSDDEFFDLIATRTLH